MVIKISALIYTLASIAFITLMIMRPAVEIAPQQAVQTNITVNNDNSTTNTEVDGTTASVSATTAIPNETMGNDASSIVPSAPITESMTATPTVESSANTIPEVPAVIPVQNDTNTIVPTASEYPVVPSNGNSVTTTMPTEPATVAPVATPPSVPVTTMPVETPTPIVTPNEVIPTPTAPIPVSPQSVAPNEAIPTTSVAMTTTPLLAAPVSKQQVTFPNADLNTTPAQAPPVVESLQANATLTDLNMPSNVINTPLVDVLAENVKKNLQ